MISELNQKFKMASEEFNFSESESGGDEWEKQLEERAKAAQARIDARNSSKGKSAAPGRSMVVAEIIPPSDETDMEDLAAYVRGLEIEGLQWGEVAVKEHAFGLKKIVMACTVVDDLVSMEDVLYDIQENREDDVMSYEVVSMNKL